MNLRDVYRQSWRERAACIGTELNFFPDTSGRSRHHQAAIATCRACEVTEQCLDYAINAGERHGIWGGTTADRRHTMRRNRREHR